MQLVTISLVVLCVATYVYGQYGYGGYGGRWGRDVHDQMETRAKRQYGYGGYGGRQGRDVEGLEHREKRQYGYGGYGGRWGRDVHEVMPETTRAKRQYGYGGYGGRWGRDVHEQIEGRQKRQLEYFNQLVHNIQKIVKICIIYIFYKNKYSYLKKVGNYGTPYLLPFLIQGE